MKINTEADFWAQVDRRNKSECWPWRGCIRGGRYGVYAENYVTWYAHRYAWMRAHGTIPSGICVCHSCDNPICCNPRHLFLGTKAQNTADRDAKGRQARPKGTANPQAKLDDAQVIRIRKYLRMGNSQQAIANKFNVSRRLIGLISQREIWKHVYD